MTLEKKLREMGHEVYVFTIEPKDGVKLDNPNVVYFSGFTVPIKKINSYRLSLRTHIKVHTIKKYKLDIIHLQTEFSMARLAILAAKKYHIPLVYTLHTLYEDYLQYISKTIDEHFHNGFLASLAKILIAPINKVATIKIVPSRKTLSMISKYYIDGEIRVVPTGLDLNKLIANKLAPEQLKVFKENLGLKENVKVYLSLGRISEEKAIDVLINAFAEAYKVNKQMLLLIVGDGPDLVNLKELAKELGLLDTAIKFLGFVTWDKIVPYYQIADAFLNASTTETQGLTYIEALACGTPLVVRYDEVLSNVLLEGENGYYFYSQEELTKLLLKFQEHPEILQCLKNKTYETISKYSEDNFAQNIFQVYKDAILHYNERKRRHFFTKV